MAHWGNKINTTVSYNVTPTERIDVLLYGSSAKPNPDDIYTNSSSNEKLKLYITYNNAKYLYDFSYTFPSNGGSINLVPTCTYVDSSGFMSDGSGYLSVEINSDWLQKSGTTYTCQANNSNKELSTNIVFKAGTSTKITVTIKLKRRKTINNPELENEDTIVYGEVDDNVIPTDDLLDNYTLYYIDSENNIIDEYKNIHITNE